MGKSLIVYYSRKGENYCSGKICNLEKGNTEIVAELIQKVTGSDLFEVETKKFYPKDYHACTVEAKEELDLGKRVEVKAFKEDLEYYDTIFVGFPNWWGTMPMVLFTFLEHYDMKGKTILPFCTNEGSGMGNSEQDLKTICTGAHVKPGLSVHGTKAAQSEKAIADWLKKVFM